MNNYLYTIGKNWQSFDTLGEAKRHMRYVLRKDTSTAALNRDIDGYYVKRVNVVTEKVRRFYL